MSERTAQAAEDVGEYCRQVEAHLARANAGHLVRIAGVAFNLVREWAHAGIPLSVVYRGIDRKAERHRAGASKRPLRLEFCASDVRALFDDWRRAVGVAGYSGAESSGPPLSEETLQPGDSPDVSVSGPGSRRPTLTRHIDRAVERLVRAASRLDLPETFREVMTQTVEQLVVLREAAAHARGEARASVAAQVSHLDRRTIEAARLAAGADLDRLRAAAEQDLATYRTRLAVEAWHRAVEASVDQLLRDRYGLPVLDPEA